MSDDELWLKTNEYWFNKKLCFYYHQPCLDHIWIKIDPLIRRRSCSLDIHWALQILYTTKEGFTKHWLWATWQNYYHYYHHCHILSKPCNLWHIFFRRKYVEKEYMIHTYHLSLYPVLIFLGWLIETLRHS